ncbi:L-threonylcarbamoyladenylate synthase [Sneathiella chinensis]|uniref:Threonylcarbamoyl-AMP synthase n=1 Tax=Sneathiella chinensis TaxID=349750 RepID=A0ABQ5U3X7_9PROT|nr:L-threonylcarbamoyladenylate synthase [Sneathiella chinensis]GLQ06533.1 threonylcarbamoyl-AMP synthase [Sneathiella chinensis]
MPEHKNIRTPSPESLTEASRAIHAGELVAFPTETVYGLGADATNDTAVAKIFEAKGRPSFNPLIIHVPDLETAKNHVLFSELAESLARKFWPGALTLVLPRRKDCTVSRLASAGLDTLAVRVPAHPLALDLLRTCQRPLAAPSANPSGQISPTTARHVADGLGDKVSVILDGGPCRIGVESTVIGFGEDGVVLLRPGGVTQEMLEAEVGPVQAPRPDGKITSPGMLLSHYAPSCPVRLNATDKQNEDEAFLGFGPEYEALSTLNLSASGNLTEATANLFSALHLLDSKGYTSIAVAPIPEVGLGVAINDRLRRAAAPRPEQEG